MPRFRSAFDLPPVVLREKAPPGALQILEFAAALGERRRLAEYEIGQAVARQLAVEGKVAGHLEGIDEVIADAHRLAAEPKLVRSPDLRHHLADREVAAVE